MRRQDNIMSKNGARLLLAIVFMARGCSFIFSKTLMEDMSPLSVLAVRFLAAFVILAIIFIKKLNACSLKDLKGGILLGFAYTVCMVFEMYGLRTIDTGTSAFIENMAIVIVPLYVGLFTRIAPRLKTMICALIAVAGVGCLSLNQSVGSFNIGVVLAILAALTYAGCILITDDVAKKGDPITIGIIQLGTMGLLSFILAIMTGSFSMPQSAKDWEMMAMLVLVCSCFGFLFQPVSQKYLSAETAAMYSVLNPLSSCIIGIVAVGEDHSALKITGSILILTSMFIYNINPSGRFVSMTSGVGEENV
jgi:drug/metabolite transporter (DMT)-like permease